MQKQEPVVIKSLLNTTSFKNDNYMLLVYNVDTNNICVAFNNVSLNFKQIQSIISC